MPQRPKRQQETLDAGTERLKRGWAAPGWVCREFLALDGTPSDYEVVQAVHQLIHGYIKDQTPERLTLVRGAITAAAVLLKGSEEG